MMSASTPPPLIHNERIPAATAVHLVRDTLALREGDSVLFRVDECRAFKPGWRIA
jgi:hypothetical protein